MDLVAEMLLRYFPAEFPLIAESVCASYRRAFSRLASSGALLNADRLLNRLFIYPRFAGHIAKKFDLFHVIDHSYSQLVHKLPAERTGVYCHDLDTFRCILDPTAEPRPRWFRAMARRILSGMQKAAIVFHSTEQVRLQIERHKLIDPKRLIHAPYGTAADFCLADPSVHGSGETIVAELPELQLLKGRCFLLHVGSCISRKRIDTLLEVFAQVRGRRTQIKLLQVGGTWTPAQQQQIDRLGLGSDVTQIRGVSRAVLASIYRSAAIVLQTSEAEGFGIPVAEALACGAIVVASDIAALREVGGAAALYCPVGAVEQWVQTVAGLLDGAAAPALQARTQQAAKFSWTAHAVTIRDAYRRLI